MRTNGTDIAAEPIPEELLARKRSPEDWVPGREPVETTDEFILAPLVDKIAYGIARGLVVAVKELEHHIATETRKVGDAVDRRLDTLQASFQDLSKFVVEQRSTNVAVHDHLQQLAIAGDGLREADARQSSELETLRTETRTFSSSVSQRIDVAVAALQESDARQTADLAALQTETRQFSDSASDRIEGLCRELGVQQEDLAVVKATLCTFSSRVDVLVERLDRQADTVRSICTAYSQRETELEQLVDGLTRLRAYPTPLPANGL